MKQAFRRQEKQKEKTQPQALLQDVTEIHPDARPYRGRRRNEEGRKNRAEGWVEGIA